MEEVFEIISNINCFADEADKLIHKIQQDYYLQKEALDHKYSPLFSKLARQKEEDLLTTRHKGNEIIKRAKEIYREIEDLENQLSKIDKYYLKTKNKKEELLKDKINENYSSTQDYFETLNKIEEEYTNLFKKYTQEVLPSLLNGLNYLFSKKRKKDYEDLIVLKNTVGSFIAEIETQIGPIVEELVDEINNQYSFNYQSLIREYEQEKAQVENKYILETEEVADIICSELDKILPDSKVNEFSLVIMDYLNNRTKLNLLEKSIPKILNMWFIDFPIDYFIDNKLLVSLLKDKCNLLLTDEGIVRFPLVITPLEVKNWIIIPQEEKRSKDFTHGMIYAFLNSFPVGSISYTIIDPENRGNSIAPFFGARKKLPELFNGKIFITPDEVSKKIAQLNEKAEHILQNRLVTQYNTIFEYAQDNPEYELEIEFLVLYDFPKGFDAQTLAEMRNLLRNGTRCGIYVLIEYRELPDLTSNEMLTNIQEIRQLCVPIFQNGQEFQMKGLTLNFLEMPNKRVFSDYFNSYMLIFEGIKNRGIAFSPIIRSLVETDNDIQLKSTIKKIVDIKKDFAENYGQVPPLKQSFPTTITLGSASYPANIFSNSLGYNQIVEMFEDYQNKSSLQKFIELPLIFDLTNSFNLFLESTLHPTELARLTYQVIWSFLSTLPVSKINICIFDSEGNGNNILPFLDFRKKVPEIFDEKIYTHSEDMYIRLKEFNDQIDEFIQNKLGFQYKNIMDFNIHTPNRAAPFTLLIIYDFPSKLDERSLDLLINILRNGNKCGIFVILCYNQNIYYNSYSNIENKLERIRSFCTTIDYLDGKYRILPYNIQIKFPSLLDSNQSKFFIQKYSEENILIKTQGLAFEDILDTNLFSYSSAENLNIPVGIGDGNSIISLCIGNGSSHHGLIAGATGSGKSTFLHTLIMSSLLHYSPDELNLYLMDFKSGTEFKIYESVRLPHLKLLALDTMQEFGESILENLVEEMEKRGKLFKEAHEQTKLKGYITETGKPMPRILVIMDEFQILFNDASNRKVAMKCAELTKRLITEGRAYGIHLFMSTQSTRIISDLTLSKGTIEQMRIRIGLKCGEEDARYLFGDDNDSDALKLMKGPLGTTVLNLDYTEQNNIGFRTAYCNSEAQRKYLQQIQETFKNSEYNLQTFEGGRKEFFLDYLKRNFLKETSSYPVQIHLGSLIKVAPPLVLNIDKKKRHNLLIVGSNEEMSERIFKNYLVSAALNTNSLLYIMDGDSLVGEEKLKDFYQYIPNLEIAKNNTEILNLIHKIYDIYQEKRKKNDQRTLFIFIHNLQFIDILKSILAGDRINEDEYFESSEDSSSNLESSFEEVLSNFDPNNPFAAVEALLGGSTSNSLEKSDRGSASEKLLKMISDGSAYGINFIINSFDYTTVKEALYYGENLMGKFSQRIIFSISQTEGELLGDDISIGSLRENTVFYTDGVNNTYQIKPYIPLELEDLKQLFSRDL